MKLYGWRPLKEHEGRALLAALLSGLKLDGVHLILGRYIKQQITACEEVGAAFLPTLYSDCCRKISVLMVNHGKTTEPQRRQLKILVDLYNSIEEWGTE